LVRENGIGLSGVRHVPLHSLEGFTRVHLEPGATKHVSFTLNPREMSLADAQGKRSVEAGHYMVFVGGGQPAPNAGLSQAFSIEGSKALPR
jgi:beta-glucosidase